MRNAPGSPYLSVVATARNDDHGGNLLGRMALFVEGFLAQCDAHGLDAELVMVEWNPPADRPRLRDSLRWPTSRRCAVRIVEVPPDVHARFRHAETLPLFQMIAKNAGIRRARGSFVLATNVDILLSDALFRFLAERRLRPDRMYRVDRHDVPADVPVEASVDERLQWCAQHVHRICARDAVRDLRSGVEHVVYPRRLRHRVRYLLEELGALPVRHRARIHTNACGDFTLLARERWEALRGYAELQVHSMHLDALFCHAAHFAGARELLLRAPRCVYHIEHGAGWTPEGERGLYRRVDAAGIRRISDDEIRAWATQMRRDRRPLLLNEPGWGLAESSLRETVVGRSEPDE